MKRFMLAVGAVLRSPHANGVAQVVAPSSSLARLGSALVLTAVLAGVQVGLVATHGGSELCRSVSACGWSAPFADRSVPRHPSSTDTPDSRSTGQSRSPRTSTSTPSALPATPVAYRIPVTSERGQPASLRLGTAAPHRSTVARTKRTARTRSGRVRIHVKHHGQHALLLTAARLASVRLQHVHHGTR